MKRLAMFLVILFLLVGCTNDNKNKDVSDSTDDGASEVINNDTEGQTKTESSLFNESNTREINRHNDNSSSWVIIYCQAPIMDLRFVDDCSEGGRDDSDNPTGKKIVAFTCSSLKANENNMFDVFCEHVVDDVSNYCRSETIENVKFEEVKVNGISAKKFTGSMRETREDHSNKDMDLYITGYIFLDEDCVAGVWGLVFDKNQDPEAIKFVNEATEYMMSTVTFERW